MFIHMLLYFVAGCLKKVPGSGIECVNLHSSDLGSRHIVEVGLGESIGSFLFDLFIKKLVEGVWKCELSSFLYIFETDLAGLWHRFSRPISKAIIHEVTDLLGRRVIRSVNVSIGLLTLLVHFSALASALTRYIVCIGLWLHVLPINSQFYELDHRRRVRRLRFQYRLLLWPPRPRVHQEREVDT